MQRLLKNVVLNILANFNSSSAMKNSLLCLFLAILTSSLFAQEKEVFAFDYTIPSAAFGDDRQITVYLPPSYYENPKEKFTVTYVLDGQFDPFIDLAVNTIEYNTYMHKYTSTIVVGIHAKARGWEFSPPDPDDEDDADYDGGRAPELQQHFKNEIFPFIQSLDLKINSFRSIVGHSSGGAFVLYSLFSDEKDLFDGYIAISPALRPGENNILENATARLERGETFNKFLYCSSGTVGNREEIFGGAIAQLDSILALHPQHGLIWRKDKFNGMGHWTCVPPSINGGMVELTRAFRVDEQSFYTYASSETQSVTDQVTAFYKNRKAKYGFIDIPPAGYIYQIAVTLSNNEKNQSALEIYNWGITQHPENLRLHKAMGRLQIKMTDKKGAQKTFQRCLEIVEVKKEELGDRKSVV